MAWAEIDFSPVIFVPGWAGNFQFCLEETAIFGPISPEMDFISDIFKPISPEIDFCTVIFRPISPEMDFSAVILGPIGQKMDLIIFGYACPPWSSG